MQQIIDFFRQLLESEQFMPRWVCGQWTPFHGWMYVISDITIFVAYMAIPFALVYFVRKRWNDLPFRWVFYMFIAFIMLCGFTHLIDAIIFWIPLYRLNAIVLMLTALVSVITVMGVLKILPAALKLEGPKALKLLVEQKTSELEKANQNLEKSVKEQTKRLQEAQAVAALGSWEMDLTTQAVSWSDELYRIFGIDNSFKPNYHSYLTLLPKLEQKKITEAVEKTIKTKKPFDIVHQYVHPDGGIRYLRGKGKVVTKGGQPIQLIGTAQDVTQDQLMQEAVIENELMMRSVLKSATDAIVVCEESGNVLKWNSSAERIFGWTEKEIMNKPMDIIMPKKYRPHHAAGMKRYIETGDPKIIGGTVEIEGLKKDGTVFPVEIALGAWEIDGHHYFCGMLRDISERKKSENELIKLKEELEKRVETRTQELSDTNLQLQEEKVESNKAREEVNRLAAIVNESDDSIISMTLDGTLTSWNGGAQKLYGYTAKEAIGQNLSLVCQKEDQGELKNILNLLGQGTNVENHETIRITKEGKVVPISISYSPLRDKQGAVVGISGIARNIADQKNFEKEQKRLIKKLEATNKELESFAYITSHDLKAPLRAIGSLSDWIYADYAHVMSDEGKEHLMLLKSRVQRMYDLIEGILQYSRVGRKDGSLVELDLNQVVSDAIKFMDIPDYVTININQDLPTLVMHKTHPTQIFENLISNAVKYGKKENAEVTISAKEFSQFWRFSVKDNGPGIEEHHQTKIFEIFQTLKSRDEVESTGIGLTIVKKIVEHAGGEIWLDSTIGQGTTFYFTLPKS